MSSAASHYQPVIGLEVHVQLSTQSKIFAPDHNRFGDDPNQNISAITIAHPGTLPLLNRKVVRAAVKMGLALNCEINRYLIFDRKNYFYPDLPKGYQLTQDKTPICLGGELEISDAKGNVSTIALTRIHLEEDAGKSMHIEEGNATHVDLNRAGVPLIEIVTEPVLTSSAEAMEFLMGIRRIVRYLGISDGNMEQGSLRCDANVSIRKPGAPLGSKVELKNMNSFKNVGNAIDHEIGRQAGLADAGKPIPSESRTFDPVSGGSQAMRTKEVLNDYRYFPEPDISPVVITHEWLSEVQREMPMLPNELKGILMDKYKLPAYDAGVITEEKELCDYFLKTAEFTNSFKPLSNWIMGPVKKQLNEDGISAEQIPVTPVKLAEVLRAVEDGTINYRAASQQLFPFLWRNSTLPVDEAIKQLGLEQSENSEEIMSLVNEVLDANPEKVKAYHSGKRSLTGMFMGELMKRSAGKIDPKVANQMIIETLENRR